jgi:hypothetical protein
VSRCRVGSVTGGCPWPKPRWLLACTPHSLHLVSSATAIVTSSTEGTSQIQLTFPGSYLSAHKLYYSLSYPFPVSLADETKSLSLGYPGMFAGAEIPSAIGT